MHEVAQKTKVDVSSAVKELEKKLKETKKEIYSNLNDWQKVQLSRHPERPYTNFYISRIFSKYQELHGDRNVRDDKAIVGVGMILFWPALFALGGTKQQEAELSRLKGEYEALSAAGVSKKCT
jgi:acetyl-CoA carboxylase carboxyl transferase subunit alpha